MSAMIYDLDTIALVASEWRDPRFEAAGNARAFSSRPLIRASQFVGEMFAAFMARLDS
jgi:hypothetical protein